MATMFPQTLGADEYVDPYAAAIAAARARLAQPQAPAFTPEEQAARVAQNQREYELGILGQLSGDQGIGAVGGQVLRKALEGRQARVTEKGTADPLRGTFTYSPDYLRERDEAGLAGLERASAGARGNFESARVAAAERAQRDRERAEDQKVLRAMMGANRTEPLIAVIGPDGQSVLIPRSQAQGMRPAAPAGGGQPSEDERKAASWLQQAQLAYANMGQAVAKNAAAASPTLGERVATAIPGAGRDIAFANMTPERQQYTTAASSLSEAILRAATGAGQTEAEARQKIEELTPRIGESAASIADKQQRALMYLKALEARAGRALPRAVGAGAAPAANTDPLGLRQ